MLADLILLSKELVNSIVLAAPARRRTIACLLFILNASNPKVILIAILCCAVFSTHNISSRDLWLSNLKRPIVYLE